MQSAKVGLRVKSACDGCSVGVQAPRIIIDGPFGAPAQEHAKFRQVLLIGMGIGITPMLSIMRDALHRLVELPAAASGLEVMQSSEQCCPQIFINNLFWYSAHAIDGDDLPVGRPAFQFASVRILQAAHILPEHNSARHHCRVATLA